MVATTQQTISWKRFRDDPTDLEAVYFRWIQPGAAAPTITGRAEQIFRHHLELAAGRRPGTALTRLYRVGDGSDLGPALQIVNDDMPLLVDSLTAALQRLGATVTEVVHPVFDVLRDRRGRLRAIAPSEGFDAAQANPDSRGEASGNVVTESWIHVQLGAGDSDAVLDRIERALPPLLAELRQVAHDTEAMTRTMASLAARLDVVPQPSAAEASDCAQLLRWLTSGHFNLLGYGYYRVHPAADGPEPQQVSGTALGVLRSGTGVDVGAVATGPDQILRLSNGSLDSLLPGSPDVYVVSVADYGAETTPSVVGTVVGEHVFVGTFTVSGLHENILDIPVISRRVHQVIEWAGLALNSFSGQALLEMLQTFPRVELFSTDARRLFETVSAVMNLGLRRQIRLFLRRDVGSNAVYCLVYLPRDRYSTEVRTRMYDILRREFDAEQIAYSARVTESELAVVYFTVHRGADAEPADITETNRERVQDLLFATTRSWADRLVTAAAGAVELEPTVVADYAAAFPASYRQEYEPERALDDLRRLHGLSDGGIDTDLYRVPGAPAGEWRFALYVAGAEVSLSRVLPVLHSLGVEVLEEQPYRLELPDSNTRWIYDFGLRVAANTIRGAGESDPAADLDQPTTLDSLPSTSIRRRLPEAVSAMWFGDCEVDGLNELVLRAGLHWRQIAMLRAYAKYLQQAGFAYTFANITRVLLTHPSTARAFTELFDAYFDPEDLGPVATARAAGISARLQDEIDAVVSLDTDRILRAILGLITATLRTNYFRRDADGNPLGRLSFKFDPHAIAELPRPRPRFEIFVYSPRVEGVHLRFGAVARGGLRWSDRLEDFRTEILGLVKAQAVKNAVIVPVGAKGGFVVKRPPVATGDASVDRQAMQAEGIACYRTFISGLLDLTDNVDHASGAVVPPERVVRRDGDDTYLVVAADKGTATFSDIANGVAKDYGFWLGDAFASGGSAGYDHKAMGITAKGAWESVKRHFAEMNVDTQCQEFSVVGVGDMSGDVFGNGMLLSEHIRLVAAFDHRHIFIDPDPVAASSFAERLRLFGLPRSSWADYDASLISTGGGVWDRTVKAIPVSPEIRRALGLDDGVVSLSPPEMIRAILCSPVQLLWNGGIGTYIKASSESNADVGDKSNDAVRVNADALRVRVIGEGGNLGVTALGRIEFCKVGGKCNTDALDNSAGVDCSDHEVNIKVLLDGVVSAGELPVDDRNPLLASMTDDVSEMVLRDNVSQNFLMGMSRTESPRMLNVHTRVIADLERRRGLDRELEALPSAKELARRAEAGAGLTSPELANLLAHVKLSLKADLLDTDLPDSAYFAACLPEYFPEALRTRFGGAIKRHRLRREIVTTMVINEMVDLGGITYAHRLNEEIGASTTDVVRAFAATSQIFDMPSLWKRIRASDVSTAVKDELELETKRTLDRASRWLLSNRPQPVAVGAEIHRYSGPVRELAPKVPGWLRGHHLDTLSESSAKIVSRGVPQELATEVFGLLNLFPLLDVVDIADITDRSGEEVGALYYALNEHLKIDWLLQAVSHLERGDRWHALARLALRDDMYGSLRSLTLDVLSAGDPEETAEEKIAYWESKNQSRLGRARAALSELFASGAHDLATLSVAARQVRSMVSGVGAQSEVPR